MLNVDTAIANAEAILPGVAVDEGDDPRWQRIIEVSEYIVVAPEPIWAFIVRWGSHPDDDLRMAVATCLLEHLLEYHFEGYFPLVEARTAADDLFAAMFCMCSKFGQSEEPENAVRFDALKTRIQGW
jgi:hypothetical protein